MSSKLFNYFLLSVTMIQIINCLIYNDIYIQGPACKFGRMQSPIQLSDEDSTYFQESIVTSVNYKPITSAYFFNNKRVLKIFSSEILKDWGTIHFKKRGYLNKYNLSDIEIYYTGEHTIKIGEKILTPEIEVKLIHKRIDNYVSNVNTGKTFTESNNYLIVSLLYSFEGTIEDNGLLSTITSIYSEEEKKSTLDLSSFDILKNNKYYMYDGSFTSFPCDEDVSYIVVRDIFILNESVLNFIKGKYLGLWENGKVNKPIAEKEGRPITRNY